MLLLLWLLSSVPIQVALAPTVRLKDEVFDPTRAPLGVGREEGVTESRVGARITIRSGAVRPLSRGGETCRMDVTLAGVRADLSQHIAVRLPRGASAVLRAHEEGHVLIDRRLFARAAAAIARRALRPFPRRLAFTVPAPCSRRQIEAALSRALDRLGARFSRRIGRAITDRIDRAGGLYDSRTQHGRRREGGGSATVASQLEAARRVLAEAGG